MDDASEMVGQAEVFVAAIQDRFMLGQQGR